MRQKDSFRRIYVTPLAVALGLAAVVYAYPFIGHRTVDEILPLPTATPVTYESSIDNILVNDNITFDMAKEDESLRQSYLNMIFSKRVNYGVEGWESFSGFVYDPDLKIVQTEFLRRGFPQVAQDTYQMDGLNVLMATPYFGVRKVKSRVYVSSRAFEKLENREDVISSLDNESFHAYLTEKDKLHFPLDLPESGQASKPVFDLLSELLSFEKQLYYVSNGTRRPSQKYLSDMLLTAGILYDKVKEIGQQDNLDGEFAKAVLKGIESRPTAKYFK